MNSRESVRNFEDEYRKYAKSSAPDLWDRIEAGIDALTEDKQSGNAEETKGIIAAEDNKVIRISDYDNKGESDREKNSTGTGTKKITHMSRYFGIAAAVACALLVVGVTGRMGKALSSNSAAESAAAPAAASEAPAAEAPAADMAAEAAPDAYAYDEAYEAEESYEADEAAMNEAAAYEAADEAPQTFAAETNGAVAFDDDAKSAGDAEYASEAYEAEETADMAASDDDVEESYDMVEAAEPEEAMTAAAAEEAAETLGTDKADDLNASRKATAGKTKEGDRRGQQELRALVILESLREEDGKLTCTMTVADPDVSKLKQGESITAVVNEPIKSRVSKYYSKSRTSKNDTYMVTLLSADSGYIITDIRQELK